MPAKIQILCTALLVSLLALANGAAAQASPCKGPIRIDYGPGEEPKHKAQSLQEILLKSGITSNYTSNRHADGAANNSIDYDENHRAFSQECLDVVKDRVSNSGVLRGALSVRARAHAITESAIVVRIHDPVENEWGK